MTEQEWLASNEPQTMIRVATGRISQCCGCYWYNNGDGTESLGAGQHCCEQCDNARPATGYRGVVSDRKLRLWVEACRAGDPAFDFVADLHSPAGLRVALDYWSSRDVERQVPLSYRAAILHDIVGNPWRPVVLQRPCDDCESTGRWEQYDRDCGVCEGLGWLSARKDWERKKCLWLTPTVLSLAQAAYDKRERKCERCNGEGRTPSYTGMYRLGSDPCKTCNGIGDIEDGTLDPVRLAILADALEEAGCHDTEPCFYCGGKGHHDTGLVRNDVYGEHDSREKIGCVACSGTGKKPHSILAHLRGGDVHVRGCWVLDLILGRE